MVSFSAFGLPCSDLNQCPSGVLNLTDLSSRNTTRGPAPGRRRLEMRQKVALHTLSQILPTCQDTAKHWNSLITLSRCLLFSCSWIRFIIEADFLLLLLAFPPFKATVLSNIPLFLSEIRSSSSTSRALFL